MEEELVQIAERYERFADVEAHGSSPRYELLARHVARTGELLRFLVKLPPDRRQPNLFLAAVRAARAVPDDGDELTAFVCDNGTAIRDIMLTRTTQTNEPARCATLLPVLAQLPQPVALLEVGASAGLCLLPDYYGYDYGHRQIEPSVGAVIRAPLFQCRANDATPIPANNLDVVWRAGLDLNPLDVASPDDASWLDTLVWPEQQDRVRRLKAAIDIARTDPPRVVAGNLLNDLPALAASAPQDATLVIYHTAVLSYVRDNADRAVFADTVRHLDAVWISNESPGVFPSFADGAPPSPETGLFLQAVDGQPVAWTAPHGQSIHWFG